MLSVYPKAYFDKIEKITIEFIKKNNLKALILDMDNTLINYKKEMPENIEKWAKELKGQGTRLYILSNTNKKAKVKGQNPFTIQMLIVTGENGNKNKAK